MKLGWMDERLFLDDDRETRLVRVSSLSRPRIYGKKYIYFYFHIPEWKLDRHAFLLSFKFASEITSSTLDQG